jgi:hypothetical protein
VVFGFCSDRNLGARSNSQLAFVNDQGKSEKTVSIDAFIESILLTPGPSHRFGATAIIPGNFFILVALAPDTERI